jgi:SAM-dependent methyltransferase
MNAITSLLLQHYRLGSLGYEALAHFRALRKISDDRPCLLSMDNTDKFAEFVTDDGRRLPLYAGYRDRVKSRWRSDYWPTIALLGVRERIRLTSRATTLIKELDSDRTLPASLNEFANVVAGLADQYPHELSRSSILCPLTQCPIIAARVTREQAESMAQSYLRNALSVLQTYARWSGKQIAEETSTLEVGCGIGYTVSAMAKFGVRDPVGIDNRAADHRWVYERPAVLARLGFDDSTNPAVQIIPGDIEHMPFDDNRFDLISSTSVLEHVHNLRGAFAEMARVLKPGGLMVHSIDPYFSPKGGHASCTLDFPWGHARLRPSEFRRYVQTFRPYEYDHAIQMYDSLFNRPRVSLNEIDQAIGKAGLSVLSWREHWTTNHLPSGDIWQEVNRIYPTVGLRDLAVDNLSLVLTR